MQRLEVRALLSPLKRLTSQQLLPRPSDGEDIVIDDELEEDDFVRALEEKLQLRSDELSGSVNGSAPFLVLRAAQIDTLASRLHDILEPKRDETNIVQAWTIQPQLQRKVKMSSHIQVLKLSTILREVQCLRVHQISLEAGGPARTAPIELDIFPSLRVVEILHSRADLLRNAHYFVRQLQSLHIEHTPMESLRELLAPSPPLDEDMSEAAEWRRLHTLELNCCGLPAVDMSVNLLSAIKTLDLGWNEIKTFESSLESQTLESLSLCHNLLSSLPPIQALTNLKALDLSVNQIESLAGIEALQQLEALDVSHNLINSMNELERLANIQRLTRAKLSHNPIARRADYRREVFFFVGKTVELDGKPWSFAELASMKDRRSFQGYGQKTETAIAQEATNTAKVFPKADGLSCGKADLRMIMSYPLLPQKRSVTAHYAHIHNPKSTLLNEYLKHHGLSSGLNGQKQEVESSESTSDQQSGGRSNEHDNGGEFTVVTVDDYFRNKSDSITSAPVNVSIEPDYSSDDCSDDSELEFGRRSRKYTASDFMRDFEEEEALAREGYSVIDDFEVRKARSASATRKPKRFGSRSVNDVRVLLNADESAEHDLYFGIDGLPATLTIKGHGWVEAIAATDQSAQTVTIRRDLDDSIAIGALVESTGRPHIITLELQREPLPATSSRVTYKVDTVTTLQKLLNVAVDHLYQTPKNQISACNCANCGAVSLYSRDYLAVNASTLLKRSGPGAEISITVYACLLCSSRNVREVSFEKFQKICSSKGIEVTLKTTAELVSGPSHLEQDGFLIEERLLDPNANPEASEIILISNNGLREVTSRQGAFSSSKDFASDDWSDAIADAITAK